MAQERENIFFANV